MKDNTVIDSKPDKWHSVSNGDGTYRIVTGLADGIARVYKIGDAQLIASAPQLKAENEALKECNRQLSEALTRIGLFTGHELDGSDAFIMVKITINQ